MYAYVCVCVFALYVNASRSFGNECTYKQIKRAYQLLRFALCFESRTKTGFGIESHCHVRNLFLGRARKPERAGEIRIKHVVKVQTELV